MAGFLKVLLNNLLEGPSTDPYPAGETFTPERVRGHCVIDPNLCVGCGMCRYSCTAGAINIEKKPDDSGFRITVWHNSCCRCASCRHFCPTGAMSLNNDWQLAHLEDKKFDIMEQRVIDYVPCAECGALISPLALSIAERLYAHDPDVEAGHVRLLCPKCRRMEDARRIERVYPATVAPNEAGDLPAVESAESGVKIDLSAAPKKAENIDNSGGNLL